MTKKASIQSAVILGSGNVAWQLSARLKKLGVQILQVYSRSIDNAAELGRYCKSEFTDDINCLDLSADLYVLAVSDDAISSLSSEIPTRVKGLLVHTSGSAPMELLSGKRTGVFYPLQTLKKKGKVNWKKIPLLVEAKKKDDLFLLKELAGRISEQVIITDSHKRLKIHLAAVFASNFSNHLYGIANDLLGSEKLGLSLLAPLIKETAGNVEKGNPKALQTGPARRKDKGTQKKHLELLKGSPELQNLYKLFSKRIEKEQE